MMISPITGSPVFRKAAFTLVEVTISLGIVAFALVSLVGLLPAGLKNFHSAMSQTIEAQIVQGISEDIGLTDFSNLASFAGKTASYDSRGVSTSPGDPMSVYTASVKIEAIDSLGSYPFRLLDASSRNEAYNVRIEISRIDQPKAVNKYALIVANERGHGTN